MTTESGAESEPKTQQEKSKEAEGKAKKSKSTPQRAPAAAAAAEPSSPQVQLPVAAGHSTPARKEQDLHDEDPASNRSSTSHLSKSSPLRGAKKLKNMQCKKRAKGHILFDKICDHLNLLEKDYFGITYRDVENQKFYPPDPAQLSEDITRYYLCLQLRDDVVSGRLPCSFATHTMLGSYTVQSELGDYDPDELASDYISELRFAPNQTKELEEKVMELHKSYKGMTPAEAEINFLENAKKLSMYGVDLHHAKDSEGVEIMLGVCGSGLLIYRDRLRINRFAWPKVLKISYKRNNFYIKILPGEFEQFESTIGFKLPNHRAAKRLWKVCVEHHTFFRLVSPEAPPKKFLGLGSKFRYSGRTQAQTRQASSQIIRPAPFFERSSSKRYNMSRSLDGAPMENHETLMKDHAADRVAKGDIITTVTPEKKAEEEKAEQEDAQANAMPMAELAASTPLRHDTKSEAEDDYEMRTQDTDASTELGKHQTNISELKRSFLETGDGDPGATEWDKRLSSSPARSLKVDEPPMIEPLLLPQDAIEEGQAAAEEVKMETDAKNENEFPSASDEEDTVPATEKEEAFGSRGMILGPDDVPLKMESRHMEVTRIKGISSPTRAKASWVSEVVKTVERSEFTSMSAKEGEQWQAFNAGVPKDVFIFEEAPAGKPGADFTAATLSTVTELSTASLEVVSNDPQVVEETGNAAATDVTLATKSTSPQSATLPEEPSSKDTPVVHTETKTITYEAAEGDTNGDMDPGVLLSAQTITSETSSTTTTTHITKMVKGGVSETRIEKRIVITGDADIDHDEALAQAIKEAKEQHPDMNKDVSPTRTQSPISHHGFHT
ncbi:hypothetical protein CRUP_022612 [Coryphaenoides rupestris]|nr:hypothetical protein CRUP_022612 [Coryphaenoides rupestris]